VTATATLPTVFDLDVDPEFLSASADAAPNRCGQDGCTNGVVKPARGRPSKFCPEHKTPDARTSSRSKASGKSWPKAAEVEKHLTDSLILAGKGVSFLNEFDGVILQTNGPAVIHELVELAKDDKTLQRYLTWLASPGKYGPLSMAVGALILPILANHNFFGILSAFKPNTEGGE